MTGCEAAGVRFELTDPCGSAVFKTAPFDRSGTPPRRSMVRGGAAGSGFARLALVELGLSLLGEPSRPLCVRDHLLPRLEGRDYAGDCTPPSLRGAPYSQSTSGTEIEPP